MSEQKLSTFSITEESLRQKQLTYRFLWVTIRVTPIIGMLSGIALLLQSQWVWGLVAFVLGFGVAFLAFKMMERVRESQWRSIEQRILDSSPLIREVADQHAMAHGAEVRDFEFLPRKHRVDNPYFWHWWHGITGQPYKYKFYVRLDANYENAVYRHEAPIVSGYLVRRDTYCPQLPSAPLPQDESWWSIGWRGPFDPVERRTGNLSRESLLTVLTGFEVVNERHSG